MPRVWSREAQSALIEVYRKHACLYQVSSPNYYNREFNRNAVNEIVEVVSDYYADITAEECKKKYRVLRAQFATEHRKATQSRTKSGSGTDVVYIPKLWCYQQLMFLTDHLKSRPGDFVGGCTVSELQEEEYDDEGNWPVEVLDLDNSTQEADSDEESFRYDFSESVASQPEPYIAPPTKQSTAALRGPPAAPLPGSSTTPLPRPSTAPLPRPSTAALPGPSTTPLPGPSTTPLPGPATARHQVVNRIGKPQRKRAAEDISPIHTPPASVELEASNSTPVHRGKKKRLDETSVDQEIVSYLNVLGKVKEAKLQKIQKETETVPVPAKNSNEQFCEFLAGRMNKMSEKQATLFQHEIMKKLINFEIEIIK